VLWQHLFWLFGHPEVYIMIMPAFGIVSEVIPVFSRKPLFGYKVMVFSGIAIGFMGWGVWVHHMFAVGLGPVANSAFAASTMFIAVPTGVKIFNWLATLWRGKIKLTTPLLFAVGFVAMFTIGGLSGVTHGVVPADTQQTDTYYIVAHFHYVLFGGSIFGLFAGAYYWYPKLTGKMLNERLGKIHFWLMLIGFNMTFGPFHILGLQGMPRRIYTYPENRGWDFWNFISTVGSFVIAVGILVFIYNLWVTRKTAEAGDDPWDARTLEWSIPSPPPEYNFAEIPLVVARDDFWHTKYSEDEQGRPVPRTPEEESADVEAEGAIRAAVGEDGAGDEGSDEGSSATGDGGQGDEAQAEGGEEGHGADGHGADGHGEEHDEPHIHLPSPSYWPFVASVGLAVIGYGMIYRVWIVAILGGVWVLGSLYAWGLEPATAPEEPEPEPSTELEPVGGHRG
jgi:cytochrome c oxidase subunit 1